MSDSRQAPAAPAPARTKRDPSARQAAAWATAGREPARGAATPGQAATRGRGRRGGAPASALHRGSRAGAGGRAADHGQRTVTARQSLRGGPPFPENLAARTRPGQGNTHRPAPVGRGRPAAKWRPAPGPGPGRKLHFPPPRPGALAGRRARGPGGRFESARGGRAAGGRTARGENHDLRVAPSPSRAPRATLLTPARVQGREQVPRGPGGLLGFGESSLPGAEAPAPGAAPGRDSAAGPAPAHTQKMLNETTPTLLAPRPSSGR